MRIGIDFDNTIVNTKETVRKFMDRYNVKEFKDEEEKTIFYRKHIDDMTKELTLKEDVIDVLNRLKIDNDLFIITARGNYYTDTLMGETLKYIKKNNIPVEKVYFNGETKFEKCLELNIDLFIDDDILNCTLVNNAGIKTLAYDNEVLGIETVRSWKEVEKAVNRWKKES